MNSKFIFLFFFLFFILSLAFIPFVSAANGFGFDNPFLPRISEDLNFIKQGGDSITGDYDFDGGYLGGGLSIIGGELYAPIAYFYNITSIDITRQNLTIIESLNVEGNVTANYFYGDGSFITGVVGMNASWNQSSADLIYLNLSGTNANQNIDISMWNLTVGSFRTNGDIDVTDGNLDMNNGRIHDISEIVMDPGSWIRGFASSNVVFGDHIQARTDGNYDIGNVTKRFRDLYLKGNISTIGNVTASYFFGDAAFLTNLNITGDITGYALNISFLYGHAGIGGMDLRGSPWYLSGTDFQIVENLTVDGEVYIGGNFTVNNTDLFVNVNLGYIGIGTTTPQQKLNVIGDINVTGTSYFNYTQVHTLNFTGNITSTTGRVGIGTLNPKSLFTIVKSDSGDNGVNNWAIYGNNTAGGVKGVGQIGVQGTGTTTAGGQFNSDTAIGMDAWTLSGTAGVFSALSGGDALKTNVGDVLLTQISGYVGIGVSSPSYNLEVDGNASIGTMNLSGNLTIDGDYIVGNNQFAFVASADNDAGLRFDVTNIMYDFTDTNGAETASLGAGTSSHESWIRQLTVGNTLHTSEVYDFEVDGDSNFTGAIIMNGNLTFGGNNAYRVPSDAYAFQSDAFPNIGTYFNGAGLITMLQSNALENARFGVTTTTNYSWFRRVGISEGSAFSPSYPLEVKGQSPDGISAYFEFAIGSSDVIDHTIFPNKDFKGIDAIKNIKSDESGLSTSMGQLEHSTLPLSVQRTFNAPIYESQKDSKTGLWEDIIIGYTEKEGRSVGGMVSINTKALQELIERQELLESELCKVDSKYPWCQGTDGN